MIAVGCLALVSAGCAGGPSAPAPGSAASPSREGTYVGRLTIDGRPFDATLRLRPDTPPTWRGSLSVVSPVEIEGAVRAVALDTILRIRVSYTGADGCEGTIDGILDVGREGTVDTLDGPVTLRDCGPRVAGHMTFRRRQDPPDGPSQ